MAIVGSNFSDCILIDIQLFFESSGFELMAPAISSEGLERLAELARLRLASL